MALVVIIEGCLVDVNIYMVIEVITLLVRVEEEL